MRTGAKQCGNFLDAEENKKIDCALEPPEKKAALPAFLTGGC